MSTGAMRRMVKRAGEDWTYTTFATGARDAYEDVAFTADATAPTIRGIRSDGKNRTFRDETGEDRAVDISVLVPFPLLDSNGASVTIEDGDTKRAATLIDGSSRIYKIVGVGHEASAPVGAKRLLCMKQVG